MRHIRKLTAKPAMQKQDAMGNVFLYVWMMAFSLILSAAFADKGRYTY